MTTDELYDRLTASALARLYFELRSSPLLDDNAEAKKIKAAGINNCGKVDFDALVDELESDMARS